MRLHQTYVVVGLIAAFVGCTTFVGCTAIPDERSPADPHERACSAEVPEPMAPFARMVPGEWRMTVQSGMGQSDTWRWGPGAYSVRNETHGFAADGQPWHELLVAYWHPGREEICMLTLQPHGWGVGEGTFLLGDESAYAPFELYQHGNRRVLASHWTFENNDSYREALVEDGVWTLAEWNYVRTEGTAPPETPLPDRPASLTERLKSLESWLGQTWEAEWKVADGGDAIPIRTALDWIAYTDALHVRTFTGSGDGKRMLLDAYIFDHNGTDSLRCLALSSLGGVYEGDVTALVDGALQLDLTGYEDDDVHSRVMRFDPTDDGTLRQRVWSVAGADRTLLIDLSHEAVGVRVD